MIEELDSESLDVPPKIWHLRLRMESGRRDHTYLRRLGAGAYQGAAQVHWSLTIEKRRRGWLEELFHHRFREILVHTAFRYGICCPIYCLMPDHLHLLWLGWREDADQRVAMKFFRKQLNRLLRERGFELQQQGYDHVLREEERKPDSLADVANYIRENPARAELCETSSDYPFSSCVAPGYPELDIDDEQFWERFWRIYAGLRARS